MDDGQEVSVALPDDAWRREFRRRLVAWYRRQARDLPWRATVDPYAIWVSEIMLQQTQVETVIPYFHRFMRFFPTVRQLADSDEEDVLRQWEGLGYYRRARQLHAAARLIVQQHGGDFPTSYEAVRTLPGVGRYTAGAVLSFALDQTLPILEANTRRLYCRLLGYSGDPRRAEGEALLWSFAASLLPARGAGRVNQALMELGSRVCTPRRPRCDGCPVMTLCRAHTMQRVDEIPTIRKRVDIKHVTEAAVVIRSRARLLLRQCGPQERWAGMWDFPRVRLISEIPRHWPDEVCQAAGQLVGFALQVDELLTTMQHGVTRYRIHLLCYAGRLAEGHPRPQSLRTAPGLKWVTLTDLETLPLHVTGRRISTFLARHVAF